MAFTSDASQPPVPPGGIFWTSEWYASAMYSRFWEQVVGWTLRPFELRRLNITAEYRDGRIRVVVEARDERNKAIIDFTMKGAVTTPSVKGDNLRGLELDFKQINSGIYVAEFKAEEAGSYFIHAHAERQVFKLDKDGNRIPKLDKDGKPIPKLDKDGKPIMRAGKVEMEMETVDDLDSVRSGVTIPYSPEFTDMETNVPLLERLCRTNTGKTGKTYKDDENALKEAADSGDVFRKPPEQTKSLQPIWYWLLVLTALLVFLQVAVRRIAVDPIKVSAGAQNFWNRLRGRATVTEKVPEYFERLRSRKAEADEEIRCAARRFEGEELAADLPAVTLAEPAAPSTPPRRQPGPKPELTPQKEPEPVDYASRLMKAKKRVWKERDKEKDQ